MRKRKVLLRLRKYRRNVTGLKRLSDKSSFTLYIRIGWRNWWYEDRYFYDHF